MSLPLGRVIGQEPLDRTNWWRTETLSYGQVGQLIDDGPADVLLTHDAPAEAAVFDSHKTDRDSEAHRRATSALMEALRPQLLVHGHYHRNHTTEVTHATGTTRVLGLGMNGHAEADRGDGTPS